MTANEIALGALNAALTHFGMDEDEWNKPTFDQMRQAVAALTAAPAGGSEAVIWQARIALKTGVREINNLGGARQAMPLHYAIKAIDDYLATQEPSAAAEPVASEFPHEEVDAVNAARYKIVDSDTSVFGGKAITVGDGTQQVYHGRNGDCVAVAAQLRRAFADGAFWMHGRRAALSAKGASPSTPEPVACESGMRVHYESKCWDDLVPLCATPPTPPSAPATGGKGDNHG